MSFTNSSSTFDNDAAPTNGAPSELLQLSESTQDFLKRLNESWNQQKSISTLLELLVHLIQPIQMHRGSTMGYLGGEKRFEAEIHATAQRIHKLIYLLNQLNQSHDAVLPQNEIDQIIYAWTTIYKDWEQDDIIENFEYHSHLIESLLRIIGANAKKLAQWPSQVSPQLQLLQQNQDPSHSLIDLVFGDILNIAENLAKLRGLGIFTIAEGQCDSQQRMRIRYLTQEYRYKKDELDKKIFQLPKDLIKDNFIIKELRAFDLRSDKLVDLLAKDVLCEGPINVDSAEYYSLCTELIEIYFKAASQGMFSIDELFFRQYKKMAAISV